MRLIVAAPLVALAAAALALLVAASRLRVAHRDVDHARRRLAQAPSLDDRLG